ncbi:MAG: hypothetical protein IKC38_00670 [Clostridia bacterium]|nr:hypothetical protein [Clostridia bacterium]
MDLNRLSRPLECHVTRVTHRGQTAYYIHAIDDLPNGKARSFYLTDNSGKYYAFDKEDTAYAFCRGYRDLPASPYTDYVDTAPVISWLVGKNPQDLTYNPMGIAFAFCEAVADGYDRLKGQKYVDASMISYTYYNCEAEYRRTGTNPAPEFSEYQLKYITDVFEDAIREFDKMFDKRVLDQSDTEDNRPRVPTDEDMAIALERCENVVVRAAKKLRFDLGYSYLGVRDLKMLLEDYISRTVTEVE